MYYTYHKAERKAINQRQMLALSLPSSAGFKRGEAFLLISDEKGGYLLIPKVKNPYTKAKSLSFHQEEAWPDFDYEDIE